MITECEHKWGVHSVTYVPPPFIMEKKPWWKFWRKARRIEITTKVNGHQIRQESGAVFVAVRACEKCGTPGGEIQTSPDAITWTTRVPLVASAMLWSLAV